MTKNEIDALLGYIEFNLVAMVEQFEKKLHTCDGTSEAISLLYDEAYEVLNEMERTLNDDPEISAVNRSPHKDA